MDSFCAWQCSGEKMKDSVQAFSHVILKKGLLSVFLLLALIVGVVGSAQAGGMVQVDRVQTGSVIEKDVFLTGENPTLDGTVNGDVFAFGSDVAIKGDIEGVFIPWLCLSIKQRHPALRVVFIFL
jgi:hypothetical protein